MTDTAKIGKRYALLQKIGEGGMGIVYHAHDRLTGQDVALKLVTAQTDKFNLNVTGGSSDNTANFRLALAREFKTLASLRHPHIISVLDYGFTAAEQPFFTMELLQNPAHIDQAAKVCSQLDKIKMIVSILQALIYLHRRGIIHRDLKPANVLVNQQRQVYVLDFGLSYSTEQAAKEGGSSASGTLSYMAPEILAGSPASKQSDLYAVGLIAYQILTGMYPYPTDNTSSLIHSILNQTLDMSSLEYELRHVVLMLLAKNPADRFDSAEKAVEMLLAVAGIAPQYEERVEIRESHLQSAPFVGRETEMQALSAAVNQAKNGQGSAWLIGGESGVGKSRLLAEVRTQALIDGALVIRGQAVADGGAPYQLWRDVVRWLALIDEEISDEEAGVAKEIAPDIDRIIGRSIEPAPPLAPQQTRERLLLIIERLLRRQQQAIVILLEDLQWTFESLEVLNHINQIVSHLPVVTVGSYRLEESPKLAETVSHNQHILLRRLDDTEVARLSSGILGDPGRNAELVELIQRQAEGNAFFVIEIIRAIVDELQSMDKMMLQTLPINVLADGIQNILEKRLARVPESARPLLHIAAVYGREVDVDILQQIAPDIDIDRWLLVCSDAAVLEVDDDTWRFNHDKLRESILNQISNEERKQYHRQVAEAIETLYPDDERYAVALATHWREAGDEDKERVYALKAGDQLLAAFAIHEAPHYYLRAKALTPPGTQDYLNLLVKLSRVFSLGDLQQVHPVLEEAIALGEELGDKRSLAQAYAHLGRIAMLRDGDWGASEAYLQKALAYSQQTDQKDIHSGVLRQLGNLSIYASQWEKAIDYLDEALAYARDIGDRYLEGMAVNSLSDAYAKRNQGDDPEIAVRLSNQTCDIARELGHSRLMMMGIAHIGLVALHLEDYELAYEKFEEGYEIIRKIRDHEQSGKVANYVGICLLGLHDYEKAKHIFQEALGISIETNLMPEVIRSLAGIALAWNEEGKKREALKLLTLALADPRCNVETHALADGPYEALQAAFSVSERDELVAAGQSLDIEQTAQTMFAHMVLPLVGTGSF
jgi:tetratricopeptide (TPR) repeat protein